MSLSLLVFAAAVQAAPLDLAIEQAAETHEVPAALLVALAFEASHFDAQAASAWGGYGLYDFREDDESFGPGIERVSALLGQSPDNIMASPELQVQGAAALLAWHAENWRYRAWETQTALEGKLQGFGVRVWDLGFRVSGFGVRV